MAKKCLRMRFFFYQHVVLYAIHVQFALTESGELILD